MTSRRGFTLLEVLIAVAILGIIMATVYGVLARALAAKNHAEERADLYATGREVVLKMADELEGALPPTAGRNIGFIGITGSSDTPSDAVQFATVIRRLFGPSQNRGGRALVSYSHDAMKDTPRLYALRRQEELLTEAPPVDDQTSDGSDPTGAGQTTDTTQAPPAIAAYLVDRVAGLRFSYLDPLSGQWVNTWDTTVAPAPGQPPIGLPAAVQITLFLADDNGGVHDFSTTVDLPLANLSPTPVVP